MGVMSDRHRETRREIPRVPHLTGLFVAAASVVADSPNISRLTAIADNQEENPVTVNLSRQKEGAFLTQRLPFGGKLS